MKDKQSVLINGFEIEEGDDFIPGQNPFNQDTYHIGSALDKDTMLMYSKHDHNSYFIVIHIPTGKRIIVNLPS